MNVLTPRAINNWKISYNPHTDLFQIFNEKVFHTQNKDLESRKRGQSVLVYEKRSKKPLMIEFKHAYRNLGDIDNMDKKIIIQKVIGYIEEHGSSQR